MGDKVRTPERHLPLLDLATRQHGVVSTRQLAEIGYTRSSASKASKVGRLYRVHRGVYVVGQRNLDWHGRCMAAVLASAPAIASHTTAGWLWGLLRSRPDTVHLTTPTRRGGRRRFVLHYADLPDIDISVVDGIPVTSLPRTYLDLATILRPDRFEKVLEKAEELKIFDLGPVEELLARCGSHPGRGRLDRALAIYRPDPSVKRSDFERDFQRLVREAGISRPSMNFVVAGYEIDAYWEAERFGVELDLYETHGSRAAFERDREREEDLLLHGIETIRITKPRLDREPEAVMRRLGAHLDRRRR